MIYWIKKFLQKTLARQLIIGISITHAILMSIFIFDLVKEQQDFLISQNEKQAIGLVSTLATTSSSWVIANDVIGIEEVILSQSQYPNLDYAMIVTMDNKVLGHTSRDKVGLYIIDKVSEQLKNNIGKPVVLFQSVKQIDVASPIIINEKQIGWARVSLDRSDIIVSLDNVMYNGVIYTIIAILIGIAFAWLTAKGLTTAITSMADAVHQVRDGNRAVSFDTNRLDELGQLSEDLGLTVKLLADKEHQLETYQLHLEELVKDQTQELINANENLKVTAKKVKIKNEKLQSAYEQLKQVQQSLVESEKLSSLGALVAGVSHEVNTPLGISYTASTSLNTTLGDLVSEVENGKITKNELLNKTRNMTELLKLMINNQEKAISLINSFKQIAIAQTTEKQLNFSLSDYVVDTIKSLKNKLESHNVTVNLDCKPNITIFGDPGQFTLIINHLIMNSILHGFCEQNSGTIQVNIIELEQGVLMDYQDNGIGMTQEQVKKVYDPFYTTKLGMGSSGLGMSIVYNIVKQGFNAEVKCESSKEFGTKFLIRFPIT